MSWVQVHVITTKGAAPLVELFFEGIEALSITLSDAGNDPVFEPPLGSAPLWTDTKVTALFAEHTDIEQLREWMDQGIAPQIPRQTVIEILQDEVWERAWMADFHPMKFGENLWICPDGQQVDVNGAIVIDLDPGLAFGTGTHPTTALCLEWLDSARVDTRQVIDFGCGSGILAIAAAKLGAKSVIAIDHDEQALIATKDNAEKNQVSDHIGIFSSDQTDHCAADILLANILAGTLMTLEPELARLTKSGGQIILSGILKEQAAEVLAVFGVHFDMLPPVTLDDWVRLEGRRY